MRKKINNAIKKMKFIKRELIIFLFFIFFFLIIVSKIFSYTILKHDYFKQLADNQQIGKIEIPVTRGNIYTKNPNFLANSVNLNNLAIDPNVSGDTAKLIIFLRGIIYYELCENKNEEDCKSNLEKFLKVLTLDDFENNKEYIIEKITKKLQEKLQEKKVTSVLLTENLDRNEQINLKSLNVKGLYINESKLYVNPEEIINPEQVAKILSKNTQIIEGRILDLIKKRKKRYTPILKKLSIESSQKLEKYIEEEKDALKRGIIDDDQTIFHFIILEGFPRRNYPEKKLAAQVVGFVDNSGRGQYGLEGYFDNILKGNKGYILAKVDIRGNTIDPIKFKSGDLYGKGAKIYSTIDRNVQAKVEEILEKGVKKFRANKGTVVVMQPKTGEIIAMANYPSYDPNNPGKVYELEKVSYGKYPNPLIDLKGYPVFVEDTKNGKEFYYNSKKILLRRATKEELGNVIIIKYKYKNGFGPEVYKNGAISDLYEPGSIMKAFTVAIGLDSGEITQNSMYQDNGSVKIDQFEISNVSDKCLGYHTFGHALNYSCNVGMLRIAQRYGRVLAYEYLKNFGFDRKTNISLSGEVSSKIRELNHWSVSNLLTSSYGLGISLTPLQMATAYSVLANGGIYVNPHIISKIVYSNGRILKYEPEENYRVLKPETSRIITNMLVDSIQKGVAKKGNVEGYNLAGKTGTSQIAIKGGYDKGEASTYASFAGFGPAEDPEFVIIVKLDRPRTSIYGGATSSEIFKNIAEFLLDYNKTPKKSVN